MGRIIMLNADICFFKDIMPNSITGIESRPITTIPDSSTASIVREFASNDPQWITEFAMAFNKMIRASELTASVADGSVAAAYQGRCL
ncbi:hypothetical protein EB796_002321 [Bugula neritina]|uniref:Uncharacterized protein n=1 Tax=Bugula neritina TaxID=10212 RepID=A0A7J7KMI8_BUGNE|nr:hypothetical protein EB796_002321 [Bugula neritina]